MITDIRFTIELEYSLDSLRFMTGREIPESSFIEEAEEYAAHDLSELLRSNSISCFAKVTLTEAAVE